MGNTNRLLPKPSDIVIGYYPSHYFRKYIDIVCMIRILIIVEEGLRVQTEFSEVDF